MARDVNATKVSTHSRLKAAGEEVAANQAGRAVFQHTAA